MPIGRGKFVVNERGQCAAALTKAAGRLGPWGGMCVFFDSVIWPITFF